MTFLISFVRYFPGYVNKSYLCSEFCIKSSLGFRLKETVKTLETEQRGKLKEWQDQMKTITDSLKNAENVITEKSVAGADVETVKNQKMVLQVCLKRREKVSPSNNLSLNDRLCLTFPLVDHKLLSNIVILCTLKKQV